MGSNKSNLREVVCLVFLRGGKILLEQRLDHNAFYGKWAFTGGKIESGESTEEAAIREAMEETNLKPLRIKHFSTFEEFSRSGEKFIFHGVLISEWKGRVKNLEKNRRLLKWIPLVRAKEVIGDTKVDRRVLDVFLSSPHHSLTF